MFKHSKYFNKKQEYDGMTFDSIKELNYWIILKRLEENHEIWNLERQTKLEFKINGKKMFTYKPDMEYDDKDGHHVIDVKSPITIKKDVYRLKKKIIEEFYNVKIEEII